jgi:hypothetical protein
MKCVRNTPLNKSGNRPSVSSLPPPQRQGRQALPSRPSLHMIQTAPVHHLRRIAPTTLDPLTHQLQGEAAANCWRQPPLTPVSARISTSCHIEVGTGILTLCAAVKLGPPNSASASCRQVAPKVLCTFWMCANFEVFLFAGRAGVCPEHMQQFGLSVGLSFSVGRWNILIMVCGQSLIIKPCHLPV